MGVVRKQLDQLVAERGERSAAVNAGMVVDEECELAQRTELVRERLGELRETPLQAAPAIEEGHKVLAELGRVAAQRTDQIREQDERIFVATLEGQPRGALAGGTQEVGVLREDGGLPEAGRRVNEREPVTLGAIQTIE